MIYERWFTVKDINDLDYLYYSEIRGHPFENAVKHKSNTFVGLMEKRMYKLLKKTVRIDLNFQHLISGMPVSFTMFYKDIPILEYGGNYLNLNALRNEIYMIDRFGISEVDTKIMEDGKTLRMIRSANGEYCIPVQREITSFGHTGRRNYLLIDDSSIEYMLQQRRSRLEIGKDGKSTQFVC